MNSRLGRTGTAIGVGTILFALVAGCAKSGGKTTITKISIDDVPVAVLTQFELDYPPGATLLSANKETRADGAVGYLLHYNDADGQPGDAAYEHDARQMQEDTASRRRRLEASASC